MKFYRVSVENEAAATGFDYYFFANKKAAQEEAKAHGCYDTDDDYDPLFDSDWDPITVIEIEPTKKGILLFLNDFCRE